ncbi:MAG: XrtA/PEP-CTERM system histidine kinase PrsK [Povalibacter sp.]
MLGIMLYSAVALCFGLLTVLLSARWGGGRQGLFVVGASGATFIWAALIATQQLTHLPGAVVSLVELGRDALWLMVALQVAGTSLPRWLAKGSLGLAALLLIAALLASGWPSNGSILGEHHLSVAAGALACLGLVLVISIYRGAPDSSRTALRPFVYGLGLVFGFDVLLHASIGLGDLHQALVNVRGFVDLCAVPLLAIAVRSNPDWSLQIFISRQIIFSISKILLIVSYLLLAFAAARYLRRYGDLWGGAFLAIAATALIFVVSSTKLRRRARVFISKHFFRAKYDYRVEWLRFIRTLSSTEDEDLRRTAVRALTQIFASPGGVLFLRDDSGTRFIPVSAWPMHIEAVGELTPVSIDEGLPQFLLRKQWIVDVDEYRESPDVYDDIRLPGWLMNHGKLRVVTPLLLLDSLLGFVVLYDASPAFELTYEDRDLLKTVGRHVATHIAQFDADRKLAESRQFEAYNRLTAFMMHDLKNSIAQLKLIVTNAERHKRNPEFVDDAISTIANAAERMTRLMDQLRGRAEERLSAVDLADATTVAVQRCSNRQPRPMLQSIETAMVQADRERLIAVIEHIIRNAQDATAEIGSIVVEVSQAREQAILTITDTGAGMDADFVRERLFRPFDSTKGAAGMGIGAYQGREYARQLGGDVEVRSSPGRGTCFTINLPLWTQPALRSDVSRAAHMQ